MRNIRELLAEIDKYGLLLPANFNRSEAVLQKCYNGCGPDWLSAKVRKILTSYYTFFEAAFLIHDYEFAQSDKTLDGFHGANSRMFANCWKLTTHKISKWNFPRRLLYYSRCHLFYNACEEFGKSAWNDGEEGKK